MSTTSNPAAVQNSNSSIRIPVLTGTRTGSSKSAVIRIGGAARRLLSSLMQSLAAPHV